MLSPRAPATASAVLPTLRRRMASRGTSVDRSQPSLEPFHQDEHADADQDDEADRGIGAGEIVALGELVDKLPEPAEIDQELHPHDIDEREDQAEPEPDEDGRQRGGEQDLPELLRGREVEALADIDQHAAGGGEPLERLEDDGAEPAGEANHHDGNPAPAEDHEKDRNNRTHGAGGAP